MKHAVEGFVEIPASVIRETVAPGLNYIETEILWRFAKLVNNILNNKQTVRYGFLWRKTRKRTYQDAVDELRTVHWEDLNWSLEHSYKEQREQLRHFLDATKFSESIFVNTEFAWYFTDSFMSVEQKKKYSTENFKRGEKHEAN